MLTRRTALLGIAFTLLAAAFVTMRADASLRSRGLTAQNYPGDILEDGSILCARERVKKYIHEVGGKDWKWVMSDTCPKTGPNGAMHCVNYDRDGNNGHCAFDGPPSCKSDSDCNPDSLWTVCNVRGGQCQSKDDPLPYGGKYGEACLDDLYCISNKCIREKITAPMKCGCKVDADCPGSGFCTDAGTCFKQLSDGSQCDFDKQCISNNCVKALPWSPATCSSISREEQETQAANAAKQVATDAAQTAVDAAQEANDAAAGALDEAEASVTEAKSAVDEAKGAYADAKEAKANAKQAYLDAKAAYKAADDEDKEDVLEDVNAAKADYQDATQAIADAKAAYAEAKAAYTTAKFVYAGAKRTTKAATKELKAAEKALSKLQTND